MRKNQNYPTVDYPTILEGRVWGDKLRLESLDGDEIYITPNFTMPTFPFPGLDWFRDHCKLTNFGPITYLGKTWGVSHLQKYSYRGWLKVSPNCYHRWYFWKPQEQDANGKWIPGTEKGIYYRLPSIPFLIDSWRWDIPGTFIDGILRHWIYTKGALIGRWD